MTAETDLLPLGERDPNVADAMRTYARACVSSATEALRADNERLRIAFDEQDEKASVTWYVKWVEQKRRAERLAEALREAREYVVSELACERAKFAGYEHCSTIASIEADIAKIDAALEQEKGRG